MVTDDVAIDRQVRRANTDLRAALTRAQYACEKVFHHDDQILDRRDEALVAIAEARRISDLMMEMTYAETPQQRGWAYYRKILNNERGNDA